MHARAALHIVAPEVDVNAKLREANIIICTVRKLYESIGGSALQYMGFRPLLCVFALGPAFNDGVWEDPEHAVQLLYKAACAPLPCNNVEQHSQEVCRTTYQQICISSVDGRGVGVSA